MPTNRKCEIKERTERRINLVLIHIPASCTGKLTSTGRFL